MAAESIEVTVARIDGALHAMHGELLAKLDGVGTQFVAAQQLVAVQIEKGDNELLFGIQSCERRIKELEEKGERRDTQLSRLESFNARLIGIAIGVGLVAGGTGFGLAKALGV